jgi:hypothetical protein
MLNFAMKPLLVLCSLGLLAQALPNDPSSVEAPPPQTSALVSETFCDDVQDNTINQSLFQAVVLANSTISNKLPDATDFRHSTAYASPPIKTC